MFEEYIGASNKSPLNSCNLKENNAPTLFMKLVEGHKDLKKEAKGYVYSEYIQPCLLVERPHPSCH